MISILCILFCFGRSTWVFTRSPGADITLLRTPLFPSLLQQKRSYSITITQALLKLFPVSPVPTNRACDIISIVPQTEYGRGLGASGVHTHIRAEYMEELQSTVNGSYGGSHLVIWPGTLHLVGCAVLWVQLCKRVSRWKAHLQNAQDPILRYGLTVEAGLQNTVAFLSRNTVPDY